METNSDKNENSKARDIQNHILETDRKINRIQQAQDEHEHIMRSVFSMIDAMGEYFRGDSDSLGQLDSIYQEIMVANRKAIESGNERLKSLQQERKREVRSLEKERKTSYEDLHK